MPIYYESRIVKLNLDKAILEEVDDNVGDLVVSEEISDRESFKRKWSALEKLVGAEDRVDEIAQDLVSHFETSWPLGQAKCNTYLKVGSLHA